MSSKAAFLALVSPPIALALDVFARSLAEIGRADDDDLEAFAKRNSRSGAPSNLDPTSSRSALRFLSVNGTAATLLFNLHPARSSWYAD
jgi:hypothetical protein